MENKIKSKTIGDRKKNNRKIESQPVNFVSLTPDLLARRKQHKEFQLFPDGQAYAEGFGPESKLIKFLKEPISPKIMGGASLLVALSLILLSSVSIFKAPEVNQVAVIKSAQTIKTASIVAGGQSVKWTTIVKSSDINSGKYLLSLPKKSKNIKVSAINTQQARDILSLKPQNLLSLDQRIKIAKRSQQRSSFSASLLDGISSLFPSGLLRAGVADLGDAVDGVAQAITQTPTSEVISTPDATVVNLSSEPVPAESVSTPTEEAPVPTEETPVPAIDSNTDAINNDYVKVEYETPAPVITEQSTDTGKQVTVSSADETAGTPITDVLASTKIPEIYKVGEENKIHIKWKNNGNQVMQFNAYDTNGNGKLDYVEWTVPHLSEQIFDIIFISRAFQLDENQNIVADIFDTVQSQNNVYATVPQNSYVRSTFENLLTNKNDLTVFARSTDMAKTSSIDVYPVYTDADGNMNEGPKLDLVPDGINSDFSNINQDGKYRILLSNLQQPTDVFDLKIVNASIDIDFIVDPAPADVYWVGGSSGGNWTDAASHWASVSGGSPNAANLPDANSNVHFNSSSGSGAVIINTAGVSVANFDLSTSNISIDTTSNGITVAGDMTVSGGISGANAVTLSGTGKTITGGSGVTFVSPLVLGANATVLVNSGSFTMNGIISGASYGLSKTGAGELDLYGANTFGGGLTVKAGTVYGWSSYKALGGSGSGTVTLGDSASNNSAVTLKGDGRSWANPIVLADIANATGTLTVAGANGTTFTGGVTGTNNLALGGQGSSAYSFATNPINNSGTITNVNSGASTTISGGVGANVTQIIQNATNSATLTIDTTAVTARSGGTTLVYTAGGTFSDSIGVIGTGNLILQNNSSTDDKLSVGNIRNLGTVTNSGSGTGRAQVSGVINTNVTGVIQNSTTSQLYLVNNNTFTSGLTVKAGSVWAQSSNSMGADNNTVTLGDSVPNNANVAIHVSGGITILQPIVLANIANATGTISIISDIGAPTIQSAITGTNNLTITNNSSTSAFTFSSGTINNVGTITHTGTSTSNTNISSVIGPNVTGIIQNSTTAPLNLTASNTTTGFITNSGGTLGILYLTKTATYSTLTLGADSTTTFTNGQTFTLASIVSNGATNHLAKINSSSAGSAANLITNSSIISTDYLSIKDSNATPDNKWYAGTHSTQVSNTGYWKFVSPITSVTGVTSSLGNGTYKVGQVVPVQVSFSGNVTVTGTPQIILSTGSPATTTVNYSSGSGTSILEFNYIVGAGNTSADLDYDSISALILNNGTIKDAATNNATLTLASPGATNSLGANKNIVIDTTNPTTSITSHSDNSYSTSTTINLTGTSSDTNLSKTEISVDGGSFVATGGTAGSWTYSATSLSQGAHYFVSKATDSAGNTVTSSTINITVDTVAPTVTINQAVGQVDPTNNSTINFTIIFSEPINPSTFTSADITTGGTAGSVVWGTPTTADNITWNIATSSIGSGGTVIPTILANKATDIAGNNNAASTSTDNSVLFDATPPVVTGTTSDIDNGIYKIGQYIPIQISFSKNVIVTGTPQLTLETGDTDRNINYVSGTGGSTLIFSYTVQAGDNSSDLDYASTSALTLNNGTIKDSAGNNATLTLPTPGATNSLGANKNIKIDTTNPATSITSPLDNSYSTATTVNLTGSSSDTNLSKTEISVDGGSFVDITGTPSSWTYSKTNLSEGPHYFVSKATDSAGNTTTSSTIHITVDTVAPIVSITSPATSARVNGDATISFTDTETTNPQCSFDDATWASCSIGGITKLSDITGWSTLAEGEAFTLYLKDTDMAGNIGTANITDIIKDTAGPTVTEVNPIGTITTENSISYTFNSTEAGSIDYSGSCLAGAILAAENHNTIIFNTLPVGTYTDCTITVTDSAGNISAPLLITPFTINAPSVPVVVTPGGGGGGGSSGSGRYLSQEATDYIIQTLNQIRQSIYSLFGPSAGSGSVTNAGDDLKPTTSVVATKEGKAIIGIYQKILNAISSLINIFVR